MYTKTFIITATALVISLSARAQEPETAKPDSLGTIQNLKEVIVVSQQELITTDADKLTYNVQADPQAESGNLIDILRNVPMLSINGEEKVLLNGSPDYKVLVNGRPTGMLAKNFEQLIKTVPASSIKEIQVITNPPVKYDAEGIGGIINIVMARRLKSGYSGSLGTQASTLGAVSGNGYINAQLGKFTISANANGAHFPNPEGYGITDIENHSSDHYRYQQLKFTNDSRVSSEAFSLEASYEPAHLISLLSPAGPTSRMC